MPEPSLSVYTIASVSADDCRGVLAELHRQTVRDAIEVIVVTPGRGTVRAEEFPAFAGWQWIDVPDVPTAGEAMSAAVRAASAPFVTYAEEHAFFHDDWAERLLDAHGRGYDAVGFAMENANPETLTSWAHLYGQFGPVVAPVASGEAPTLAGHHVSYRRELLLGYGDLLADVLEDENALFLDLRTRGVALYIAGDAVSPHINLSSLRAYMHLDHVGQRSFAATRAAVGRWPWWKRAVYAGGSPLVPLVRLRRILAHLRRSGRYDELMPGILTRIVPALAVGAVGEAMGYLLGPGDAARQKIPAEFKRETLLSEHDPWQRPEAAERREAEALVPK